MTCVGTAPESTTKLTVFVTIDFDALRNSRVVVAAIARERETLDDVSVKTMERKLSQVLGAASKADGARKGLRCESSALRDMPTPLRRRVNTEHGGSYHSQRS